MIPQQAADAAMATSGLAVVLSGLTVIASVTGIYLINTPVLQSMATGAILAVAVAVLTSTTLTPAVLATFGRAAAKRSSYLHWSRRAETTQSRFWSRWTGWVMRRPWLSALAASALLLTLAAPAFSMVLGNSMQRQFDPTHEIRGGVNAAAEALGPGALGPVRVLVTFPDGNAASAPAKEPALDVVRQRMAQGPNVVSVSPPVFGDDYRRALLSAVLSVDPEDMGARETVDWMREQLPRVARRQRTHRRRRADGADQGLRRPGVGDAARGVRVRRADRVRDAADLDPVGVPGVQGRPDDGAVGGRRLRQPCRRLPVGLAGRRWASSRSRRWTAPSRRWCWR